MENKEAFSILELKQFLKDNFIPGCYQIKPSELKVLFTTINGNEDKKHSISLYPHRSIEHVKLQLFKTAIFLEKKKNFTLLKSDFNDSE